MKTNLTSEIKANIKENLATQGLVLDIFVLNSWAFTDAASPAFEEAAFMDALHSKTFKKKRGQ